MPIIPYRVYEIYLIFNRYVITRYVIIRPVVWKTFPSSDGSPFFTSETAATHLGLLFNLDWFQPFTYTQHSTGVIYASICNLPRSERNKPENIIYLGFLPGSKEVGLERINHYLVPIVDEFLELWRG